MTLYLIPKTYNSVAINSATGIDCMQFSLPSPNVVSGIKPVAGGELFDFNYGTGAILRPSPLQLAMTVVGATASAFQTTFNNFFGLPPTGFYGEVHTLVADVHGAASTKSCQAELTKVEFTQDVSWYSSGKAKLSGLIVTFTLVENFS